MTQDEVIRAWKDPAYRAGLNKTDLQAVPANPAGMVELSENELTELSGGTSVPCSLWLLAIILAP